MKEEFVTTGRKTLATRSKTALYVGFTAIGVLAGYEVRDAFGDTNPAPIIIGGEEVYDPERPDYDATMVKDMRDALFPSPTATNTPYPTATGTVDPMSGTDFCDATAKEGELCKVPWPDPPTPTPYAPCGSEELSPGEWCIVRRTSESSE